MRTPYFPRNHFPSCHPLISVKTRELLVVIIIINTNYICVTSLEEPQCRRTYTSLTAEIPHWLNINITSSDITQHKTSPVLTDVQTTCIMRLRTLSSGDGLMALSYRHNTSRSWAQCPVDFPIGGHINVLSIIKKLYHINVMLCSSHFVKITYL